MVAVESGADVEVRVVVTDGAQAPTRKSTPSRWSWLKSRVIAYAPPPGTRIDCPGGSAGSVTAYVSTSSGSPIW